MVPHFFAALADRRRLLALAAVALLSGVAMLPAMRTMSDHGESLFAFEGAGSIERSEEIVSTWGEPGKRAAWWQLALDTPFLIAYGLFAAGACAAVASRGGCRKGPAAPSGGAADLVRPPGCGSGPSAEPVAGDDSHWPCRTAMATHLRGLRLGDHQSDGDRSDLCAWRLVGDRARRRHDDRTAGCGLTDG